MRKDKPTFLILFIVLATIPLLFGAVHPLIQGIYSTVFLLSSGIWLVLNFDAVRKKHVSPVNYLPLVILAFMTITLIPLPSFIVDIVSPTRAANLSQAVQFGQLDSVANTLSYYIPATQFYAVYGLVPSEEAMIGMWQQNLGVTVEAETIEEYEDWVERLYNREFQLFQGGWGPDYYDPQNYLEVLFHSESGFNHFAYSNPDLDAALEAAAIEQDEAVRLAMYQDIEQQILADLPAVPFYQNRQTHILVKPYVKGYFIPLVSMKFWEDLSIEPH